jgi:hypothetical protein
MSATISLYFLDKQTTLSARWFCEIGVGARYTDSTEGQRLCVSDSEVVQNTSADVRQTSHNIGVSATCRNENESGYFSNCSSTSAAVAAVAAASVEATAAAARATRALATSSLIMVIAVSRCILESWYSLTLLDEDLVDQLQREARLTGHLGVSVKERTMHNWVAVPQYLDTETCRA